jgi:polysaccharide pyruvyl transferase WcaK-like protein
MKVLTITLHSTTNPGSSLQAFALQHFLIANNIETEIIDYRPEYTLTNNSKLKTILKKFIYYKEYKETKTKNDLFVEKYLRLTKKRFFTYEDLESEDFNGDVFITGSDQLWNSFYPCGRDRAFYLNFLKKGKKLAYSVSLGKEEVDERELNWICSNIQDFDFVSVREESSKHLLEKYGIPNVAHVCDPVLLLDREVYSKMLIKPQIEKYIVVYLVNKSPLLEELLAILKKKYGFKVVLIGAFRNKCTNDIHIRGTSPLEFLGFMANAEYIVASSFHATLFAHIFEKKFVILPPEQNSARIEQFLSLTGLEEHILRSRSDIPKAIENINYVDAKKRMNSFIAQSKKVLLEQLEKINQKK